MSISFSNIKNQTVLLRADLNEPIDENATVGSTKRIDASINTIHELVARKNNVIIISHHSDANQTLAPIATYIQKNFPDLVFIHSADTQEIKKQIDSKKNNEQGSQNNFIVLIENLRAFTVGGLDAKDNNLEENNDEGFAKFLASLSDVYVYDAFSVAHRKHASTVSVSRYTPHTLGPIAEKELAALSKVLSPDLVILGGAKLSTKLPLVEKFLSENAKVFLGGAMAHPILIKKGVDIKKSYIENIEIGESILNNKNLYVPTDYVWDKKENNKIVDAGHTTMVNLKTIIQNSNTILWNGPLGMYEDGYVEGTHDLISMLDQSLMHNGTADKFIVVGGGDTLTVLDDYPKFSCSYISLSGGAMLEFLAKGSLPGIEANR